MTIIGFVNKPVNGFGVAQYASYTLTDTLTLNGRVELFRDDNNFFVASFSGNNDPVRVAAGPCADSAVVQCLGPPRAAGTHLRRADAGRDLQADALPAPVTGLLLRPEVRWDHAFTDNDPFNQNPPAFTKRYSEQLHLRRRRGADILIRNVRGIAPLADLLAIAERSAARARLQRQARHPR